MFFFPSFFRQAGGEMESVANGDEDLVITTKDKKKES